MQTIPIFFTFDRYYVVPACVAIYSLLKNASKEYFYQLFVLHTDLNERHFSKICGCHSTWQITFLKRNLL